MDYSGNILKSIIVYKGNPPLQTIDSNKEIWGCYFEVVDWNFDKIKDISVLYDSGGGGCSYWIWNYSKESGTYYYNTVLSGKMGLEIDTISNYIIFHYRGGWSEEYWDTLNYKDNKLTFIKGLYRERWIDSSGNI